MNATTIGLDIAKQVFQVHGADKSGKVVLQRKLRRSELPGPRQFPAIRRNMDKRRVPMRPRNFLQG